MHNFEVSNIGLEMFMSQSWNFCLGIFDEVLVLKFNKALVSKVTVLIT